jgi:hypothetical protein
MGLFVQIIPFLQDTSGFSRTTIANIGQLEQTEADFFLKHRADMVAAVAIGTISSTIGFVLAKLHSMKIFAFDTAIFRIARGEFFAFNRPLFDFPGDGGLCLSDAGGNLIQRIAPFKQNLDLQPVSVGKMCFLRHNEKLL